MRWTRGLAIVLLGLAFAACGADPAAEEGADAPPAEAAPGFTLPRLGGGEVTLSDLAGGPVVIDFWATWCAPCVAQIPTFNAFQQEFGDRVTFLAIATDAKGEEVVGPFAESHGIAYPVLIGSEAMAQEWGIMGFPTLFVIDPDGTIREAHVGPVSATALRQAVAEWIGDGA